MGLVRRAVSLAGVPLGAGARMAGAAGRAALGADRTAAYDKATQASVDALVTTLAKVRGPAMKFGQALAVFSSALPPELADKLESLSRLYEQADPLAFAKVAPLLSVLPAGVEVEEQAVAAASLGQVHRATWTDGRPVAVKLRYPDAPRAVRSDMAQLRAMSPLLSRLLPSLDLRALLDEHAARLTEELDYEFEAGWMHRFAQGWQDSFVHVPAVVHASESVLVTEWLDGMPFTEIVSRGSREQRDAAGSMLCEFTFASPRRVFAIHADPHPGNFRLMPDGRLGVLDFGSVGAGAGLFTQLFATTASYAASDKGEEIRQAWVEAGLADEATSTEALMDLLDVDTRIWTQPEFTFSTEWLSTSASRWTDPGAALEGVSRLRFPPSYLLEHRAVMGTLALASSLGATVPMRRILDDVLDEAGPL
ncbi:MAG: ABC1 kinase family protein [Motilibacteraceae bacterium]